MATLIGPLSDPRPLPYRLPPNKNFCSTSIALLLLVDLCVVHDRRCRRLKCGDKFPAAMAVIAASQPSGVSMKTSARLSELLIGDQTSAAARQRLRSESAQVLQKASEWRVAAFSAPSQPKR